MATTVPPNYATASLYIGDLHPDVTEALLFEIFSAVGQVASIRVCRDAITRRSLGYAYVNFANPVDAERALDTLNFNTIKGRPCRIMWSCRDPSARKSGEGNIFIKNLAKGIDHKSLYDTFSMFGNILSCKVAQDENGESKGYAFVHFETKEAAESSMAKVNGMLLLDKQVFVGPFQRRDESDGGRPITFNNVFVKNLDEEITTEQLEEHFGKHGKVLSAHLVQDDEGKSKCFGFISFETAEMAAAAVEAMDGKPLVEGGKDVFCGRAQKKQERESELRRKYEALRQERSSKYQGINLYVKNIDEAVDEDALRKEFEPFGTISSVRIMREDDGRSRGFGFVCFTTPEEATKAVTDMNGRMLQNKPLYVALAQRKEQRRAQLEARHAQRQMGQQRVQMPGQPMYGQGPVFYAQPNNMGPGAQQVPQQQRGMYPNQQMMQMARPRWQQQQQQGMPQQMQQVRGGYGMPQQMGPGGMPMANGRGAPMSGGRGGRGGGRGAPAGGRGAPGQRGGMATRGGVTGGRGRGFPQQEQLTSTALSQASPAQQKQMLGERLFPMIQASQPEHAGKITGMLLEMDNGELLVLLESQEALQNKITEAMTVLQQHQQAPAPAAEAVADATVPEPVAPAAEVEQQG